MNSGHAATNGEGDRSNGDADPAGRHPGTAAADPHAADRSGDLPCPHGGSGGEEAARDLLADVAGLSRSVGFRIPDGELAVRRRHRIRVLGPALRGSAAGGAASAAGVRRIAHQSVTTPGDLLFHIRARRMDLCFELAGQADRSGWPAPRRWSMRCTASSTSTSATCSASSTAPRIPPGRQPRRRSSIGDEDPEFAGGSYVIVQKYLHDLDTWNADLGRGAGARHRAHQARRHRTARRRQAVQLARRAEHDRR